MYASIDLGELKEAILIKNQYAQYSHYAQYANHADYAHYAQ